MSDLRKKAEFNARMVEDHAASLTDDLERGDYESVLLAVDSLMTYAGRLMQNLEDIDNESGAA